MNATPWLVVLEALLRLALLWALVWWCFEPRMPFRLRSRTSERAAATEMAWLLLDRELCVCGRLAITDEWGLVLPHGCEGDPRAAARVRLLTPLTDEAAQGLRLLTAEEFEEVLHRANAELLDVERHPQTRAWPSGRYL